MIARFWPVLNDPRRLVDRFYAIHHLLGDVYLHLMQNIHHDVKFLDFFFVYIICWSCFFPQCDVISRNFTFTSSLEDSLSQNTSAAMEEKLLWATKLASKHKSKLACVCAIWPAAQNGWQQPRTWLWLASGQQW
jgi:hypothetical protein